MTLHGLRIPMRGSAAYYGGAPLHRMLDSSPRFCELLACVSARSGLGVRGMENMLAREVEDLVHAAFEKSWPFVSTDPVLAEGDVENLRLRLSLRLQRLAQSGERDVWRLANGAIGELRRELAAA
jgi:hypothetical protein